MFWLAEDHCVVAPSASSWNVEGGLDVYVGMRGLQLGAHAEPDGHHSSGAVGPGRSVSERRGNAILGAQRHENRREKQTHNTGVVHPGKVFAPKHNLSAAC